MNERIAKKGLIVAAIAAFFATLSYGFVYDDAFNVVDNLVIRDITKIKDLFLTPSYPGDLYRPITYFTFALNYSIDKLDPWGYHLINILLHVGVTSLIFGLLRTLFSFELSFFASLLFAVHPIHVEAVANITGRAELLSAFFGLAALRMFLSQKPKLVLGGTLFVLSILSKESGLVFIPLYFLVSAYQHAPRSKQKHLSPLFAAMLVSVLFTFSLRRIALGEVWLQGGITDYVDNPLYGLDPLSRMANSLRLLGKYLALNFGPIALSADYSYSALSPVDSWTDPKITLELLVCGSILWVAIMGIRERSAAAFFGAWFFLSFLLTSNFFFPIGTIFGERLSYLPSIGPCGLIAGILVNSKIHRFLSRLALLFVATIFYLKTWEYRFNWRSNDFLFMHQILMTPQSAKTQLNYATLLRNRGQFDEAISHASEALKIYPAYVGAHEQLSELSSLKGDLVKAESFVQDGLSYEPSNTRLLNTKGRILLATKRAQEALIVFNLAVSTSPGDNKVVAGKLAALISTGKIEEARDYYQSIHRDKIDSAEISRLANKLGF